MKAAGKWRLVTQGAISPEIRAARLARMAAAAAETAAALAALRAADLVRVAAPEEGWDGEGGLPEDG